jgi:hypothetical protein
MLSLSSTCAILLLLSIFYNYIIYRAFVSPLAKVPNAHWSAPITSFWIQSKRRNGGTGIRDVFAAHKKYGPTVRVASKELSTASLDGIRQI